MLRFGNRDLMLNIGVSTDDGRNIVVGMGDGCRQTYRNKRGGDATLHDLLLQS